MTGVCQPYNCNVPDIKLRDIAEVVDPDDPLQTEAANGTKMLYVGWIEVTFRLVAGAKEMSPCLS